MDDFDQAEETRAEAAEWFARLKSVPVSRDTLEQFFEWRKIGDNGAAFDMVERFWSDAGGVADRPGIDAATRAALARLQTRGGARKGHGFLWAAGLAAAVLCAGVVYRGWATQDQVYATKVGERRVVKLEDGSHVTLDTDTRLDVRFARTERRVQLDHGQAYFEVAHSADRPFTVDAGGTAVLATGTQFEVRRDPKATEVTLLEGRVLVTAAGGAGTTSLTPGQRLQIDKGAKPLLQSVDGAIAVAWRRGQIILDNRTLTEAVNEINRYTDRPIRLAADRYAGDRLSGSFTAGDTASFAAAAAAVLPVKADRSADGTITLVERDLQKKD